MKQTTKKKECALCSEQVKHLDYKEPDMLRRFISPQGRINGPKRTGCCNKHQRVVKRAVKRSRYLGLLPYQDR